MGISQREYARRRGISESGIRHHLRSGLLKPAVLPDRTIDPKVADRLLDQNLTRGEKVPAALTAARTRRLRAKVALTYDGVQTLRGSVVDPRWAEWEFGQWVTTFVWPYFRKLPDIAPTLVGVDGPAAHRLLREGAIEVLESIQRALDEEPGSAELDNPAPDFEALGPVALETLLASLHADRMTTEREAAKGLLAAVEDVKDEQNERLAVAKSILMNIPSRAGSRVPGSSELEIRDQLRAEVEEALSVTIPTEAHRTKLAALSLKGGNS